MVSYRYCPERRWRWSKVSSLTIQEIRVLVTISSNVDHAAVISPRPIVITGDLVNLVGLSSIGFACSVSPLTCGRDPRTII